MVTPIVPSAIQQDACTSGSRKESKPNEATPVSGLSSSQPHSGSNSGSHFNPFPALEGSNLSEHERLRLFGDFVSISHPVMKVTTSVKQGEFRSEETNL